MQVSEILKDARIVAHLGAGTMISSHDFNPNVGVEQIRNTLQAKGIVEPHQGDLKPIMRLTMPKPDLFLFSDWPTTAHSVINPKAEFGRAWPWTDEGGLILSHLERFQIGSVRPSCLDLCCGVGTVSIGLKKAHPDWAVSGFDSNPACIEFAELNSELNGTVGVHWWPKSYQEAFRHEEAYDVIVADPPFLADQDKSAGTLAMQRSHADISLRIAPDIEPILDGLFKRLSDGGLFLMPCYTLVGPSGVLLESILERKLKRMASCEWKLGNGTTVQTNFMSSAWELLDERIWRYCDQKLFQNPTPVDRMIIRAVDPVRTKQMFDIRYDIKPSENAKTMDVYLGEVEYWDQEIKLYKDSGYDHLAYVMIALRKEGNELVGAFS